MLKLVEDVGAPVAVIAADMLTDSMAPKYNEWVNYGLTVLGYVGAVMDFGGGFVKNLGISAAPLSARALKARFSKTGTSARASAPAMRQVSRYPAPAFNPTFQGVRLD